MEELFEVFDSYVEKLTGGRVLRYDDKYDERFNNVLITTCVCFSESEDLITKFNIHYHPYSLLSGNIKDYYNSGTNTEFYKIDYLRLKRGIDNIYEWQPSVFSEFEFIDFAESMSHYWSVFRQYKNLSNVTKKYYTPISTEDILRSNKGLVLDSIRRS